MRVADLASGVGEPAAVGRRRAMPRLVALECALVIAVLAATLRSWWAARWVQDDAYVSFRYARNLVRGHGLVYNVGQPVEGYTNFLWTVWSALPLAAGAEDPLLFMHITSLGCWIGVYGLLLLLGWRLASEGLWAAPLAVLPLAAHWSFNMWFFSGMETPLMALLTIAAVACVASLSGGGWRLAGASACAVGLIMARADGAVLAVGLALAVAVLDRRALLGERRWSLLLPAAAPVLLVLLPYELWRLWFYGSLLPNTYYAKVAYLPHYARGWEYVRTYLAVYDFAWCVPLVAAGVAAAAPASVARRYVFAALLVAAAGVFYVVRLGGDFMEWRFLVPVIALLYPAVVIAAAALGARLADGRRSPAPQRWAWTTGVLAAAALTWVTAVAAGAARQRTMPGQETIALLRRYADRMDWRGAADAFDAVLPAGVRIATTSAGIVPFFCDRPCLDLHGLTDPEIASTPIDAARRGRVGHEHWLRDPARIRARGVDVVLEWVAPSERARAIVTPPQPGGELMSVRTAAGTFVDMTVLDPELAHRLRSDSRVVAFDSARLGDRGRAHLLGRGLAGLEVVDALDWGSPESEAAHALTARPPAVLDQPPRQDILYHVAPRPDLPLADDGRGGIREATWEVRNVDPSRDLVVVVRVDHRGQAVYDIDVNGNRTKLGFGTSLRPGGAWGEVAVRIPRALLGPDANRLRLARRGRADTTAGVYYMWFLQPAPVGQDG
jgi:arabinofuranosyltransferase